MSKDKPKFYSQYNKPRIKAPVYSPEIDSTSLVIDNGVKRVKVFGKTNFQDKIECSCSYHTVKQLVKRFQQGDISALNSKTGFYADITGMPTNILEAHKLAKKTLGYYNGLDKGLQKAFGSYDDFVKSVNDNSFSKIVGDYYAKIQKNSQAPVKAVSVPAVSTQPQVPAKEENKGGENK